MLSLITCHSSRSMVIRRNQRRKIMEVAPGIHRIEAPLGDRFVAMYLLVGDECTLLLDTGLDKMPDQYIAPYLDQIGVPASKIRYVINSHADFDHTAGNASAKE